MKLVYLKINKTFNQISNQVDLGYLNILTRFLKESIVQLNGK